MTDPLFIVGSGRSGTRTLFRMLTGADGVEIHHEYNVLLVQRLAVLYKAGIIDRAGAASELYQIYHPALAHSKDPIWIDSSNKCAWLIDILSEIFPSAKFLSIVRDGRKVVSSFYYKLREEMYDDQSNDIMTNYLLDPKSAVIPPLEKKYWWYVPVDDDNKFANFKGYERFERTCFHWAEVNRVIRESFELLGGERTLSIRLEDLTTKPDVLQGMCEFIGIENDVIYEKYLTVPRNVFFPLNFNLTTKQLLKFRSICAQEMAVWGYDDEDQYEVKY